MTSATAFGTGLLSQVSAFVYHLLVVELLLVVTAGPGLVVTWLLAPDVSNLPLGVLCLLPVGPALSAALYAVHHRRLDLTELRPAALFRRGYRLNFVQSLQVWGLSLIVAAFNLISLSVAGAVVLAGVTLWMLNALVVSALFSFRSRDVWRLSAYLLVRTPSVTVANLCLLVVTVGVVVAFSEVVLGLLGSVLVLAVLGNTRRLVGLVRTEFTR
ncbi:DUF624 domain-containing protein [Actinoplanes couchii]|uniref:DUF624 domain-containing protein n=1 Tax=Actinoplanes couchii TaxID=403638 RepID=A0ABQ3XH63_9ACTN|nr:DUF624 domain-containing protein [Actinoplanes couchii]MDR6320686.1 hypothetical protein [Actinoplanes couchii]GID57828.1 hypothetical protein Aco03nite_062320 [Actinoplanes couchii]